MNWKSGFTESKTDNTYNDIPNTIAETINEYVLINLCFSPKNKIGIDKTIGVKISIVNIFPYK